MWIKLDSSLFETNQYIEDLKFLLHTMSYESKFNFFIDINEIENIEVFDAFYHEINEIIYENYNRYVNDSPKESYVVSETGSGLSLKDAIRLVNDKFYIILEHSTYDGYFLDSLVREFNSKGKKIKKYKENGWIEYVMGGGATNIKTFLQGKNLNLYRCFVLIDSDKEYLGQPYKNPHLESYFNLKKIPYHILEKREKENYLPTDILASIIVKIPSIQTYLNLSELQKDYYDLENGFQTSIGSLKNNNTDVFNLYSSVSPPDYAILRKGFKNSFTSFKADFSELFEKASQKELLQRTSNQSNPNELKEILDKITALL